jgi:N-acetylneuraminic acid mutarotase
MTTTPNITFRPGAPSPIARFESGVTVVRGKMFVIGGHMQADLVATNRTLAYDPKNDQWESCANAPFEVGHVIAATVDERYIWIAGGCEGQHPGKVVAGSYRYDAVDDRWDSGPPLPEARASGGFALMGRHLHHFGGMGADRSTNFDDHWVLDVDTQMGWERRAPVPQARTHAAAVAHENHIYAIGGHFGHDTDGKTGPGESAADLDFVHRFDAVADRWEEVAPLPRRRSHSEASTFVFQDTIVCVGGRNNSPDAVSRYEKITLALQFRRAYRKIKRTISPPPYCGLDDIIGYDIRRDQWFDLGTLPHALYAPAAAAIGDEVIAANGGLRGWRDPTDATLRFRLPLPI